MKKTIQFSRLFRPLAILSIAVIVSGLVSLHFFGINMGIDFQAGFIEKVRIAPPALELTYSGGQSIAVTQSSSDIIFVITGVDRKSVV